MYSQWVLAVTLSLLVLAIAIDIEAHLEPRTGCTSDNVLRALRNPKSCVSASAYCTTYIRSTISATATVSPTSTLQVPGKTITVKSRRTTATLYPTIFGEQILRRDIEKRAASFTGVATYPPSRISSACSCFLTTQPPPATTTVSTETDVVTTTQTNRKITTTVTAYATTYIVPAPSCAQVSVPTPGSKGYPLRVEGEYGTTYEGTATLNPIYSSYGNVTLPHGGLSGPGTAFCGGTNGGANPKPGNTPLNTLYNGAATCPFYLDGLPVYGASGDIVDFFITDIGANPSLRDDGWTLLVDYRLPLSGPCETEVTTQNEVLWAYNPISDITNFKSYYLKLSASATVVAVGETITFHVIDGLSGSVMVGALIAGGTTDNNGNFVYTCTSEGYFGVKASAVESVRSNIVLFYCFGTGAGVIILP